MPRPRMLAGLIVALAATAAAADSAAPPTIAWTDDLGRALDTARESRRPVLADFWAVWCAPCQEMERTTYAAPEIVERSAAFVPVKVDTDLHPAAMTRFDAEKLPTLLLLDQDGGELGRVVGYVSAEALAPLLATAEDGYADYLDALGRPADPAAVETVSRLLLSLGNGDGAVAYTRRAIKAGRGGPPEARERLDLLHAEALIGAGQPKPAGQIFDRLVERGHDAVLRRRALVGSVRAAHERGDSAAERAARERLEREFPDTDGPADGSQRP